MACCDRSLVRLAWNVESVPRAVVAPAGDSRPSNIMVLKKPRFVVGNGRRYVESVSTPVEGSVTNAQPYGACTTVTVNWGLAGTASGMRIRPCDNSRLSHAACEVLPV